MADPWFGGLNSSEKYHMKKTMFDEEAEKYFKMWKESLARRQERYIFKSDI